MYTVIYFYRVNKDYVEEFKEIKERISDVYTSYGALEDHTYDASDVEGQYGYKGLLHVLEFQPEEKLLLGQSIFRNKSHYQEVINHVNQDEEINELFDHASLLIDISKVVTASFTCDD